MTTGLRQRGPRACTGPDRQVPIATGRLPFSAPRMPPHTRATTDTQKLSGTTVATLVTKDWSAVELHTARTDRRGVGDVHGRMGDRRFRLAHPAHDDCATVSTRRTFLAGRAPDRR